MSNELAILANFLNICDQWDIYVKAGKIDFVSHEQNLLLQIRFLFIQFLKQQLCLLTPTNKDYINDS